MSAANFNNMSVQYLEAVNSFEQDLFTPFVYGAGSFVATKDGTNASQLDVTAGVAFLLQTDSTLRRRAPVSSTQSTTGHPSTTMFLDLNPDGSWSWGTSHSAVSGHLTIASVTTDSSANIAAVSDARTLSTTLLSGLGGPLRLNQVLQLVAQAGSDDNLRLFDTNAVDVLHMGWELATGGFYLYDNVNAGYIMRHGTSSGLTIIGALSEVGGRVAVQGSHSAGQPALSYGAGVPAALATNEIYFQTS